MRTGNGHEHAVCEIWTKSVLESITLYHMLISCFLFYYNVEFIYILRIWLEVSSFIQFIFKNPLDKRLSGLLAVIQDARINGTIPNFGVNIN